MNERAIVYITNTPCLMKVLLGFHQQIPGSHDSPRCSKISTSQITAPQHHWFSSGSRVLDISFEGFFENELESDFLSFLHSSKYENRWFYDSEIIRKHLRMTVIKTVKYPPVQSEHQTPSRVFFFINFCDVY